jgi:hypothetical protein
VPTDIIGQWHYNVSCTSLPKSLMDESIKPIKIFLSYAHQDDEYRHELMVMSAKHVKFFLSLSAKNIVSKNSANRSPIFGWWLKSDFSDFCLVLSGIKET